MTARKSWDRYFMDFAEVAATRSTCARKHVGCVLVYDKRIIATGYNGSIPGEPHCDDAGHDMKDGSCVRTVHAEVNAVVQAARMGIRTLGATSYVNTYPCWKCFQVLSTAGIERVVYVDSYRIDERVAAASASIGLPILALSTLESFANSDDDFVPVRPGEGHLSDEERRACERACERKVP